MQSRKKRSATTTGGGRRPAKRPATRPGTQPGTQAGTGPRTRPGKCAFLKAVNVTRAGAFMDAGLERDLLVPISQQQTPISAGLSYVVYPYLDPKNNLIGSTRLHNFLDERAKDMAPGQAVELLIAGETGMGFKAVVNDSHLGLLYKDEVFQPLKPGDRLGGYIKSIREDRKIDLCLQKPDAESRDHLAGRILAFLEANGGKSTLTDYSAPEEIYRQYGVSKGNYKKALGQLYKQRRITLSRDLVSLVNPEDGER